MRPLSFIIAFALALPSLAAGKKDDKAQAKSEFARIVARVADARKAASAPNGPAIPYQSLAKDWVSYAKEYKSAEAYFNAGALLEESGARAEAEKNYHDAIDVNTNFAPAHVNLGELAYKAGDLQRADQEFNTALRLDPKNVQAYNDTALMLFERAQQTHDTALYKDAIGKLRRALAVDSESIAAYSLLALVYYTIAESDRSKLDLAELVCKQAKEVNDKFPPIYNTLGLIKVRKKNVTGALGEFRKAVELSPTYIEAQLNIGAITLSARDYQSAEKAFKAALDANPTIQQQKFDATIGMGVALRGQRRIDEAEQWYNKAKQVDARNCAVIYNMGVLYQDYKSGAEGDFNKAKALFNDFISCGRADQDKLKDATRRIKDIDDTFKAIAEQKKLEAEQKAMQEEMERMQKQQEEQMKQMQQQQGAPPAPGAPAPGPAAPGPAAPAPPSKAAPTKAK